MCQPHGCPRAAIFRTRPVTYRLCLVITAAYGQAARC
jgi:hypothetical protein